MALSRLGALGKGESRLGSLGGAGGYPFVNPEARAVTNTFTTPATPARKALIDNLVGSLKSAGVWTALDILYITAAETAQAARINWKNPGTFTLSPQNSPTFTVDRGYAGDGATSYLLTGYVPSTNGVNCTQDNASLWAWSRSAAAGVGTENDIGSNNMQLACRSSANQARCRVNEATTSLVASTDGSGLFGATRASAPTKKVWRNGVQLGADISVASTGVATINQSLGGNGSSVFSARQLAAAAWGSSLTGQEASFYNAMNTYMTAIGAA